MGQLVLQRGCGNQGPHGLADYRSEETSWMAISYWHTHSLASRSLSREKGRQESSPSRMEYGKTKLLPHSGFDFQ